MSLTEEARAPFSLVDEINQVRHPSPTFMNSQPCIFYLFIFDISREWINEPNGWYTTQWSMWHAKPKARNISWSLPSCCLTWCIMKGWKSCAWITESGCLMTEIRARWWIWLTGMWRAGGTERIKWTWDWTMWSERLVRAKSLFFLDWWTLPFSVSLFHLPGIFSWWISW